MSINRIKRYIKEAGWFTTGQIASFLGSMLLVRLLTEQLDPAQYGKMSLGLTVGGMLNGVIMGGVINAIGRYYSISAERQGLGEYMYSIRRILFYATLVSVVISMLFIMALLWLGYSKWIVLSAASFVYSILSAHNGALSSIQSAARQRSIVAFHGTLDAWLKIGLALLVMFWLGNSSTAVLIGFSCSSLITILSQLVFLRRTTTLMQEQKFTKNHKLTEQMWAYSLPFAIWGIFGWAQQSSARWALEAFATTKNVGLYSVVSQLGYTPIQIVTSTGLAFISPIIFERIGDASSVVRNYKVRELMNKMVILGLGLTALAVFTTAIFHSYIFHLFVSKSFFSVSYLLPFCVLAGGIFSVAQLYASRVMALLKPQKIIPASIGSSIIGISAAFVGTYYFSLAGAVFSMVVHAISYFLWIFITARSIDKQEL